jgi:signal transduction histidine kinase
MREFAIPLLEASKIKFDINIQEDIRSTSISMEARKNIFMVFKECINNILKHSCCTAMQVSVKKLNNQLEFVIADNGKGFDMQAQSNRNGLKNIRRRAGEIKGTLQISSGPGSGTTVRLLVNTI